jgi:hypothetical protein
MMMIMMMMCTPSCCVVGHGSYACMCFCASAPPLLLTPNSHALIRTESTKVGRARTHDYYY